eukprot:2211482-Amphidinium_carterae.2
MRRVRRCPKTHSCRPGAGCGPAWLLQRVAAHSQGQDPAGIPEVNRDSVPGLPAPIEAKYVSYFGVCLFVGRLSCLESAGAPAVPS